MMRSSSTKGVQYLRRAIFILIFLTFALITVLLSTPTLKSFFVQTPQHNLNVLNSTLLINETCKAEDELPPLLEPPNDMAPALKEYAKLHHQWRMCLFNSNNISATMCKETPQDLILYRTQRGKSGGFGDRIITIRLAFMIAVITRRLFLINWQVPGDTPFQIISAIYPAYINWHCSDEQLKELFERKNKTFTYSKFIYKTEGGIHHPLPNATTKVLFEDKSNFQEELAKAPIILLDYSNMDHKSAILFAQNVHAKKYTQGLSDLSLLKLERTITDFLFRPSRAVEYLSRIRSFPNPEQEYLAVHARTGDDVSEQKDGRFVGMHDEFRNISRKLLRCIKRADSEQIGHIFLASDSLTFKGIFAAEAARNWYKVSTSKRYVWHLDRNAGKQFINQRDNCFAFLDVFADAYALSNAKTVIFFPSQFPRVSIALGSSRIQNWHELVWNSKLEPDECSSPSLSTEFKVSRR